MLTRRLLVTVLAAMWALQAAAVSGSEWVAEVVDPDFPDDRVVYFHSGEKVRVEGFVAGLVFLIDLGEGEGYIVDEERGFYAGGKLEQIVPVMSAPRGAGAEAKPGEGEEGGAAAAVIPGFRTASVSGEEMVAGFGTRHYMVYLEDLLVEELWIATELPAATFGTWGSLNFILQAMTGTTTLEDFAPGYEAQAVYQELLNEGYLMRRVTYYRKEESKVEVVKVERKDLSAAVFEVPANMKKRPYRRLFFGRN
jgi:hypothetical protein